MSEKLKLYRLTEQWVLLAAYWPIQMLSSDRRRPPLPLPAAAAATAGDTERIQWGYKIETQYIIIILFSKQTR